MPELEKVRREYEGKGVGFVALSLLEVERVPTVAQQLGVQMRLAYAEGEVLGPLGVNQVPSTVFIDARGVIVASVSGERDQDFFERRVRELLKAHAR
ncbi:TlpA family protein disulfide reductase [Archangium gephyra]|nr:TlpA family protein disulfide reductase [Archangium gephyra]